VIYKGKVDWWIGLAILFGIGASAVSAIRLHQWALLVLPGLFAAFVLIVLFPQTYESTADALRIRHGMMTNLIQWPAITSVSPSSDSRSSMALSLDRVLIEYAGRSIMIAPDDQVRFFDDVASHCPQLSRRGMDLVIAMN
jgi:hypothetical protein